MYIRDGFPGQRLVVIPRPLVAEALARPVTGRLTVTDCGYFPTARDHGRRRDRGVAQAIVILNTKGRGICRLRSGTYDVAPGQCVIIPPGAPHFYRADEAHPWTIWWAHMAGTDIPELLAAARVSVERPVVGVRDMFRATGLINEALERLERDDSRASMLAASGAAWHLLALVAADQRHAGAHADPISQARAYLREHSGERISVAELAGVAGMSPSHFAALFRKSSGFSVLQYQTRQRMMRARALLDTTDQAVAEIAEVVGYPDAFYFSRQFRAIHGVSPTQYRAAVKG